MLLAFTAFAQPVTVLDRIGTNYLSTDDNPGGLIAHYAHGSANELWGTCGTVWTQPFRGTLAEVALSWTNVAPLPELWTTTNVADGPWEPWPMPLTTNFFTITNVTGQQFFRLRVPGQ